MTYDTKSIADYAERLAVAQKALKWLEDYGPSITHQDVKVAIGWYAADGCEGAKEAANLIALRLENGIQEAIANAIEDRRNTIVILRGAMLELLNAT